jgi:putative nucleotidyltransferase with HDIG domain
MNRDLTQRLATAVNGMPAFPKSVRMILELTRHIDCTPKDLVQVIDKDPVLTVRILKVVNSAYYGLAKPITTVNQTVVFLGFNTIKNLALSIAAIGMLPRSNTAGFDVQQYLLHSLATGGIARQLSARVPGVDSVDCFMAGLLHDFGKVVFAQFMPDEFGLALELSQEYELSLHLALRKIIGVDHASVGAVLAEKWHFAPNLVETIGHQYGPELLDTDLIACVFAANQISKKLGFGFGGNACIEELPPAVAARLGGNLEQVIAGLGDLTPVYREAQAFAQSGSD